MNAAVSLGLDRIAGTGIVSSFSQLVQVLQVGFALTHLQAFRILLVSLVVSFSMEDKVLYSGAYSLYTINIITAQLLMSPPFQPTSL